MPSQDHARWHTCMSMLDYLRSITLKSVIGDKTSVNDDIVNDTNDRERNVSLIAWYPNSFDSAQHVKAHRFTCASYNSFEVLYLDHIGPLTKDANDNEYVLVIIDAFSRWVELVPTKSTTAAEIASMILNHVGRFGSPEVIYTDQGPAFHNKLVTELIRLCGIE